MHLYLHTAFEKTDLFDALDGSISALISQLQHWLQARPLALEANLGGHIHTLVLILILLAHLTILLSLLYTSIFPPMG